MKQKLKDSFLYAFRRSMPIMIGYFALGSANGILMAQKGYSVGLTGIASLGAVLPPVAAVLLVAISMLLTFIAGLIPSRLAAKKDPVVALRTE